MNTTYSIQLINGQMLLLDENGNGCDCHQLQSVSAANRQLFRWYKEHKFNFAAARQAVLAFFRDRSDHGVDETIEQIAKNELNIPTLASRSSDQLDFHEVSVGQIKLALQAAYEAGRQATK